MYCPLGTFLAHTLGTYTYPQGSMNRRLSHMFHLVYRFDLARQRRSSSNIYRNRRCHLYCNLHTCQSCRLHLHISLLSSLARSRKCRKLCFCRYRLKQERNLLCTSHKYRDLKDHIDRSEKLYRLHQCIHCQGLARNSCHKPHRLHGRSSRLSNLTPDNHQEDIYWYRCPRSSQIHKHHS